ncbi:MAG TPA: hypothetical protein VFQ43_13400 [Nitrososphaera sp.]|nr:hypothetical protein [Nitrososphaera sp.]
MFTKARRDAIGYINGGNPVSTATATLDEIWPASHRVFQDYPDLLEYVRRFMNK